MKKFSQILITDLWRVITGVPKIALWIIVAQYFPRELSYYIDLNNIAVFVATIVIALLVTTCVKKIYYTYYNNNG